MDSVYHVLAGLLVCLLLGLAGYFAWQQRLAFRTLREQHDLSAQDRRYIRWQAWRRLVCSGLMVVLAGLLAGWFALGLGDATRELGEQSHAQRVPGEPPVLTRDQQRFVNLVSLYVIVILLVLLSILGIAGFDLWAIRRFGIRHQRKIQEDRRAMIEHQVARMRSQRNGQE